VVFLGEAVAVLLAHFLGYLRWEIHYLVLLMRIFAVQVDWIVWIIVELTDFGEILLASTSESLL